MLTPEKIDSLYYNKIIEMYDTLNINISADIINKFKGLDSSYTKSQLKTIIRTGGREIFEKALLETAKLDNQTKTALKNIFTDVIKEDLQSYKPLFEYRDKPFKISPAQYNILNVGLKNIGNEIKNLTKSIAFASQELYINVLDEAYNQVITGGLDYITAIQQAYDKVAQKGITLKDSIGRDVALDVAIRRNVLAGVQDTTNNINADIDKELGCDGYEVTSHIGARPTHAEAQGKQYALNKKDASKYNVGLWSNVSSLWSEFNCRHTFFGIILGISEPVYSKNELKVMKDKKVNYKGKQIPEYEATTIQRQIEREIRNKKREIAVLKEANVDYSKQSLQLKEYFSKYNDFIKQTGLIKQPERIKI